MSEVFPSQFAQSIDKATEKCPGCLYNCYINEEALRLDFSSLMALLKSGIFLLAEIPMLLEMARIRANRKA